MKRLKLKLAGGSLLAFFIAVAPAAADSFTYDGSTEQIFTAPIDGVYDIIAYGAQGGTFSGEKSPTNPGKGAEIGGEFTLTAGEVLEIYVGGEGGSGLLAGGGGGGTFVVGPGNTPLVVAGGGGGAAPGGGSQSGETAASSANGGPTEGGEDGGGGGGGLTTNGASASSDSTGGGGGGGLAFPTLTGGAGDTYSDDGAGGFGGGGGAGTGGGGGGGGYSGGYGGGFDSGGGGGGSYDAGSDQILIAGENSGAGRVTISQVSPAPEPGTIALFGIGLIGLSFIGRSRRQTTSKTEKRNI